MVVVSANGEDLERKNAVAAKEIIKTSARPLVLVFRDASMVTVHRYPVMYSFTRANVFALREYHAPCVWSRCAMPRRALPWFME